jgi:putative DNA primase/helicase
MSDDPKKKLKQQLNILLQDALDTPTGREPNRRDPGASGEGPGSLGDERGGVRSSNPVLPRRLAESNRDATMISDANDPDSIEFESGIESVRESRVSEIPKNVIPIKPGTDTFFPAHGQVTPSQIRRCLNEHPEIVGVIRFDTYRGELVKARTPPWKSNNDLWTDVDTEQLKCWLSDRYSIVYPTSSLEGVLSVVGYDNEFDSLQDEIKSFQWDGKPRVDNWIVDYIGAEGTTYHKEVSKRWLISAIARAMDPGCKADHVLILEGGQGARKSQAIEAIAGPKHYSDSPIDLNSSFAPQQLVSVWIYELPELVLKKAFGNQKSKAFLSQKHDDYSPKHMRRKIHQLRHCVFAGSTNESIYHDDATGDRRSWSVFIEDDVKCNVDLLHKDRSQIIAEAYQLYLKYEESKRNGIDDDKNPFTWWLNPENEAMAREEQDTRYHADVWEEAISQWLAKNFDSIIKRGYTTVSEILFSCLKIKPKDWRREDEMRISKILTSRFKWRKGRRMRTDFGRVYPYTPPKSS